MSNDPEFEMKVPFISLVWGGVIANLSFFVLMAYHDLFQTFDVFMSKYKDYIRNSEDILLYSSMNRHGAESLPLATMLSV